MTLEETIHKAMLNYLVAHDVDAASVSGWSEEYWDDRSGCDTCYMGPEWWVEIYYSNSKGDNWMLYRVEGRFGDFVTELTAE